MDYDHFAEALTAYHSAKDYLNGLSESVSHEESDRAGDSYSLSHDRLIATPARSISDLRAKMEVVWADKASTPSAETVLAILADCHRLTNYEPSRAFNAAEWLDWFERNGGGWIEREGEMLLLVPEASDSSLDPMDGIMHELAAFNGAGQVKALIRKRTPRA